MGAARIHALTLAGSLLALALAFPGIARAGSEQEARAVPVGEIRGVINPVMVRYVERVIEEAEDAQAPLVIFTMDTPGGLDSSMREIVQRILRSRVPVAVYVAPAGARAGSAGVFIVYSAHIAAMAPATNIGSAHPVMLGEGSDDPSASAALQKATNDAVALIRSLALGRNRNADWAEQAVRTSANLPATEAFELNVIDVVAEDIASLLREIDGRSVRVGAQDVRLATAGLATVPAPMNVLERFFHTITDPTIAYLLMSIGGLALVYELANPGAILPGVVGGIALLLGLFALGTLEINAAGAGFIIFGLVLLVADLLVAGTGVLTVGSIVSFALGSLLLATSARSQPYLQIAIPVLIMMTVGFAGFAGLLAAFMLRSIRQPAPTGGAALIGKTGVTQTEVGSEGMVLVAGELWQASAVDPSTPIPAKRRVRVVAVDGLHITVQPE